MRIVIDPGHGGGRNNGGSSACGVRGPQGTREADVTLRLARLLADRFGSGAVLARRGDDNPSLSARAEVARRSEAAIFLSLHANQGPTGACGPELWVHPRGGAASRDLALHLGSSLARLAGRNRGVLAGDLAVLRPERLAPRTAACLVEVDYLSDARSERRLRSEAGLRGIADALVHGVRSFVSRERLRYGFAATSLDRNDKGFFFNPAWPDEEIGLTDASGVAHVGFNELDGDANHRAPAPLTLTTIGYLDPGDGGPSLALVDVVQANLNAASGAPAGFDRFDLVSTGARSARTWAGDQVMARPASGWDPLAPASMSATIRQRLDARSRIVLYDPQLDSPLWVWMSFSLSDEPADTERWVPPGHGRSDLDARAREIDAEIEKIPAAAAERQSIEQYRNIIVAVAAHEGSFGAVSPNTDDMASLGIFQWGAPKKKTASDSSLGRFFRDLSDRAAAPPAGTPPALAQIYTDAWGQCTAQNLGVQNQQILVNGAAATGASVETLMHAEMAKDALRTYQLIAAVDWIERFRGTIVRPGVNGKQWIQNGYDDPDIDGQRATLKRGATTFELRVDSHLTIGEIFTTARELASAVILGVNRPHFVETAAWRTLAPANASALAAQYLSDLATELTSSGQPLPPRVTDAEIDAAGTTAQLIREQIRELIWPIAVPPADQQWKMVHDFRRWALKLYKPADARTFHREQRFSTLEMLTW
ncbi:MAG TPA: N-acetylmuramoyl-L-alanine amidase [Myxococcales bacterium]